MSNIALFNTTNVPAHVRNAELSAMAKALMGSGGTGKRISIKGGVFRLITGGKEVAAIDERFLDVVIVAAAPKISRVFYIGEWDSDNPVPPACWSQDGAVPDAAVKAPPSATCMACPNNIAGSGKGDSRACRFQQRVATVLANHVDGDVLQLTVPAMSIFGKEEGGKRPLQAYARYLASQNPPVSPESVVTRMRFDTNAESPKLFFNAERYLTDEEYAIVQEQALTAEAKMAITMTAASMDGVTATPLALSGKAPGKAVEPTPAPAPAPESEAEQKQKRTRRTKAEMEAAAAQEAAKTSEPDEPSVRTQEPKSNAVPSAGKSTLASIVADWDDE